MSRESAPGASDTVRLRPSLDVATTVTTPAPSSATRSNSKSVAGGVSEKERAPTRSEAMRAFAWSPTLVGG